MAEKGKKLAGCARATGRGTVSAAAETCDYECKRLNQGCQRCQKLLPDDIKRVVANQCDKLINNSSMSPHQCFQRSNQLQIKGHL